MYKNLRNKLAFEIVDAALNSALCFCILATVSASSTTSIIPTSYSIEMQLYGFNLKKKNNFSYCGHIFESFY